MQPLNPQPPYQQRQYPNTSPAKYPRPLAPTQPAYNINHDATTEKAYFNPYMKNPYELRPPPPPSRANWKRRSLFFICALSLITSVVLGYLYVNTLTKPETTVPAKLVTVGVTPTSQVQATPTALTSMISKTPLLEKNAHGDWQCYVINDPSDTSLFAALSNSSYGTLFTDCANFMGQGNYYSTPPINSAAGNTLQCEGWATDNTVWKVQALYNDLPTVMMCSDLEHAIPGTQG